VDLVFGTAFVIDASLSHVGPAAAPIAHNTGRGSAVRRFVHSEPLLCRLTSSAHCEPDGRPGMARLPSRGYVSSKHQLCDLHILVGFDNVTDVLVPFGESLAHDVNITLTPSRP
jgi:hypothetical protein